MARDDLVLLASHPVLVGAGATSSGTRGEPVAICLRQTVTTISDAVTGAVDATSLEERRLPSVLLRIFTVAPPPLEGEAACLPPIRT
ncbi:hypothetical protein [Parafrankia sp. CH37]|uniref:hypothetical protein n=1 Tax=Parafrankia sp. CH37 TaxID=683308 RepID=UPI001041DA92|nr:hypothetical protein [Parafrankia sp. CH37]